jgi:predicted phage tail protein
MPLSEQEQRLLEEMERNLYQNDADFVATVSQRRGKPNYTVVAIGVLVVLAGVAVLIGGVMSRLSFVGILGFAIMFAGVLVALAPPRKSAAAPSRPQAPSSRKSTSFMAGLNDRWDKRQDERGQ